MNPKKDIIDREIKEAEKAMLLEEQKTAMRKKRYIMEMKAGLGAEIKKNPGKVKIIKKNWLQRLIIKIKSLFTKF